MADDGEPPGGPPPRAAEATPLGRYARRMRRARAIYSAVIGVIVVAVGVGVAVAWANGETAHVTLHTVPSAPKTLPLAKPSDALTAAWRTADRTALGDPVYGGTIITWSNHTVRGRDVRTGQQTWSYTRTDRSVCAALQLVGTTVAVYEKDGNCDEVTGLSTATGQRSWTRTLDEDGRPVNGRPSYQVFTSSSLPTAVIRTASVIYAIDPGSGEDRWTWYHYGCAVRGMVLGSAGALISQSCSRAQQCDDHRFCGPGVQLLLRDGGAGYDTDNHPKNPDRIIWNRFGDSALPVSADSLISALPSGSSSLRTYRAQNGKPLSSIPLRPAPASGTPQAAVETAPGEVVTVGGTTYALVNDHVRWALAAPTPPTVISTALDIVPALDAARITVATASGLESVSGRTGAVIHTYDVPVPSGAVAEPLGAGFVVSASTGTIAYR